MKYLLIDTNVWATDLLSKDADNYLLATLESWVINKHISLLIPEVIKNKEWPRVKVLYTKDFKETSKKFLEPIQKSVSLLPALVTVEIKDYENRIARITNLLDSGIFFCPSKEVKAHMMDRQLQSLAPFHNKSKSVADALIYFSSIEYMETNGIQELYFISKNKKDFQESKESEDIHEALKHKNIQVHFFSDLGHAIHTLRTNLPEITIYGDLEIDKDYINQFILFENGAPISIIDQLNQTLNRYYDQLPFIPTHILTQTFPFKIVDEKNSYTYNSPFTIHTNNEKLITLLNSIEIQNGIVTSVNEEFQSETSNSLEKLHSSLWKLNNNNIFNIYSVKNPKGKDIRLKENEISNCLICCFNQLEFSSVLKQIHRASNQPEEQIKIAYMQYRFGNFSLALKSFYSLHQYATSKKKYLLGFICLYNLKRLQHYIRASFLKIDDSLMKISNKIDSISLDRYILTYSSESNFVLENMNWINDLSFYNESYIKIVNVVEKIREHYLLQLSGGWSSNSHLNILLSEFAEIDIYLEKNCIIYSNYSEFRNLFNRYMDGLFMSHALSEKQSSRLVFFDDYLLLKLIFNGDPDKIIHFFKSYNLKSLKYDAIPDTIRTIDKILIDFYKDYSDLKQLSENTLENNGFFFWNEHKRILHNSFLILAITDLPSDTIPALATSILSILYIDKSIRKNEYKYLAKFILRKGKYFDYSNMKEFLRLSVEKEWLHEPKIFEAIAHQILGHYPNLIIEDPSLYDTIISNFFNECTKCKTFHDFDILVTLYPILSEELKEDLKKKIENNLSENFNPNSYYIFSIYSIIEYQKFLQKFIAFIPINKNIAKIPYNTTDEIIAPDLSNLLNICFKYNIDLNQEIFKRFKGCSNYYDWLLDMNNFDYSYFNAEWILEYPTTYYIQKIFNTRKAQIAIKEYLKKHKNSSISEYYIANC